MRSHGLLILLDDNCGSPFNWTVLLFVVSLADRHVLNQHIWIKFSSAEVALHSHVIFNGVADFRSHLKVHE